LAVRVARGFDSTDPNANAKGLALTTVPATGQIVLGGAFSSTLTLDGIPLITAANQAAFVARLNPDTLNVTAALAIFTEGDYSLVQSLTSDALGNLYATIPFNGAITIADQIFASPPNIGSSLFALAKVHVRGGPSALSLSDPLAPSYTITPGTIASAVPQGLAADSQGNVYLGGLQQGTIIYGDFTVPTVLNTTGIIVRVQDDSVAQLTAVARNNALAGDSVRLRYNEDVEYVDVNAQKPVKKCGSCNNSANAAAIQLTPGFQYGQAANGALIALCTSEAIARAPVTFAGTACNLSVLIMPAANADDADDEDDLEDDA